MVNILISGIQGEPNGKQREDKILASKIDTITLQKNKLTNARRTSAIPQLKCIGGNAMGLFEVEGMRCRARGQSHDKNDIQWSCTADMHPHFKLGSTQVLCEGYDHPDDPYILKGSCGVEYRLILTHWGEKKYDTRDGRPRTQSSGYPTGLLLFGTLYLFVACIIGRGMHTRRRENLLRDPREVAGTHHGDSNDDDNDDDRPYLHPFNGVYEDSHQDHPPPYTETPDDNSGSYQENAAGTLPFGYGTGIAAGLGVAGGIMYAGTSHNRAQESNVNGEGNSTFRARNPVPNNGARDIIHRDTLNVMGTGWNNSIGTSSSSHTEESTGFGGTTRR